MIQADTFASDARYQVCFTPAGACEDALLNDIAQAKTSLQMQAYSFTSRRIANALLQAQARGVKVEIIIDKSELQKLLAHLVIVLAAGIPVWAGRFGGHCAQ